MKRILFLLFFQRIGLFILLMWSFLVFVLILFEFFRLSNDFSFLTAIGIALLSGPQFLLITLPFACTIGAALAMQKMLISNEMAVLRSSGLSPWSMVIATIFISFTFIVAYLITSELILPSATQLSKNLRGDFKVLHKLWLHNNDNYIRIEKLLPNGEMQNITIYDTSPSEVEKITTADTARYVDNGWVLYNVKSFRQHNDSFIEKQKDKINWPDFSIPAQKINSFTHKPRDMSILQAWATSNQMSDIGQNNAAFKEMIWQRFLFLLGLPLLTASSLWFISGVQRKKSMAAPLFFSLCIAAAFFFLSQITVKFSILDQSYYLIPSSLIFLILVVSIAIKRQS